VSYQQSNNERASSAGKQSEAQIGSGNHSTGEHVSDRVGLHIHTENKGSDLRISFDGVDTSSVYSAAAGYIAIGLSPLPLPPRSKRATQDGWPNIRLRLADVDTAFQPESNIGVILGEASNGLHDVDCDCPEAIAAAPYFLPHTEALFGRDGSRSSHYLFVVDGECPHLSLSDPTKVRNRDGKAKGLKDKATIVELRGTGQQTVFPPSLHADTGELVRFERSGSPANVDAATLVAAVGRIASVALLSRYWAVGERHLLAMALAGGLLRSGWSAEDAEGFIRVVAEISGDDEVPDRVRAVADTKKKLDASEATTGWNELGKRTHPRVPGAIREWLNVGTSKSAKSPRYQSGPRGIVHMKPSGEGVVEVLVTNWHAAIKSDVMEDDGVEQRRTLEIEGCVVGRQVKKFHVSADDFNAMNWHIKHLGAAAVIYPSNSNVQHAKAAVQILSPEFDELTVYGHTGWRNVDGAMIFLHADGAIGANGTDQTVEVRLTGALGSYALPDPPSREDLVTSVQAALALLDLAPRWVSYPLLASVFRAVMGNADYSIFVVGPTGCFKSEMAALIQRFFGANFTPRAFPGSWTSTANSLEEGSFRAKDVVFVVDDFKPSGGYGDDKLHQAADRLLRGQANGSARQRLTSSAELRSARPVRSLILSTGEDIPRGQSLRGRMLIFEISKGEILASELTRCQKLADDGHLGFVTAAFCRWMASKYEQVQKQFKKRCEEIRQQHFATSRAGHSRLPSMLAACEASIEVFLQFVREATGEDALTKVEAETLLVTCKAALVEAGAAQIKFQMSSDPIEQYFTLLISAITSGRAHVCATDGSEPPASEAWGWRSDGGTRRSCGDRIGWVNGDDLYLDPVTAYRVANQQVGDGERLAVAEQTLRKRLNERGHLLSTEQEVNHALTIRKVLQGSRRNVLHVKASLLMDVQGGSDNDIPV